MGALAECDLPVAPGTQLTLDIVGVGPVVGRVRWAQPSRFGMLFDEIFDLKRLALRRDKLGDAPVPNQWYVGNRNKTAR